MDDKKDNIVSKGTMKVTSYYEYEIKRKENNKKKFLKNIFMYIKNFFEKESDEEKILENITVSIDILKKELFWIVLPIVSSMMYFIINGYYQIKSAGRFYLPSEYFNIPLSKVFLYLFLFLGIPIFLLVMKILFEKVEVNLEPSSIKNILISLKIIIVLVIEVMLFILFYTKVLSEIENFYEKSRFFFLFEILFWAISFFLISSLFLKKIRYSYINLFWSALFMYVLKDKSVGLIFAITTIILVEISLKEYNIIIIIIILDCVIYVILFSYLIFLVPPKNYEIFYKDNEPKVIITTYEDKYLIMDCDYKEDQNMIENIYTKDYELIKVDDIKNTKLNYADCSEEFNIKHQKKEK